jgi:hypothetical protein
MRRRRWWLVAAVVAAVLAVAGACGVPPEDEPRAIPDEQVPDDLLQESPTTVPEAGGPVGVDLWWIDDDGLLTELPGNVADFRPATAIAALLAGAPDTVRTSIPAGTELLGTSEEGGTLVVDLSEHINAIQGDELKRALAQIVWTSTEDATINGVLFRVDGEDLPAITDEGIQNEPVLRSDFTSLQPAPEPTTTTGPDSSTTSTTVQE